MALVGMDMAEIEFRLVGTGAKRLPSC